jgi:hypothetical protein
VCVKIAERTAACRRERRVLLRVSRAAWRLEQAERERNWALAPARAEGISIRTLAPAIGLSPSRVHQIVADADLDALDAALGELRAAGWSAPEDPDGDEDTDLDGSDHFPGSSPERRGESGGIPAARTLPLAVAIGVPGRSGNWTP